MASVAQIQANRLNAQKSTGPRTAAGKERASQNALKHGLLAREAVIQGEDPEEFELFREGMLEELTPVGVVEEMLAQRVVGLSWRLRRAERLQNAAFAALDEGEPEPLLEARHEEWKQLKGNEWERSVAGLFDEDAALGRVIVEDFGGARVLDRLLMYERRIEGSLYRTMAELHREREARTTAAASKEVFRSEGNLATGHESVVPAELGSFELGATPKRSLSVSSPAQELPPGRHGQTSLSMPPTRVDRFSHTLSRAEGALAAGQESAAAAKLASFDADPVPEEAARGEEVPSGCGCDARFVTRLREGVSSSGGVGRAADPRGTLGATDTSRATATVNRPTVGHHGQDARAAETPDGVTTNDEGRGMRSLPETLHASPFTLHDRSCETNPISGGV